MSCWWPTSTGSAPIIFRLREMGENEDIARSISSSRTCRSCSTFSIRWPATTGSSILRKRTRPHRILTKVEEATEEQRKASLDEQSKFVDEAKQQIEAAQNEVSQEDDGLGRTARIWIRG